ncbi:MAG: hypothetical protein ACJ795_09915 [Ktedonobacteraceae bacterium]|jgi:glutamate-1-semialdehyde aminotransferase
MYTTHKNGTGTQATVNYARARNIDLIALNWAEAEDEYIMKMDGQTLIDFLEAL